MLYSNRRHSIPVVGTGMVEPYTGTYCVVLSLLISTLLANLLDSEIEHQRKGTIKEVDIPKNNAPSVISSERQQRTKRRT